MSASSVRIGMGQILVEGGNPAANLERAMAAVAEAGAAGCQIVVLPECLDLGWTDPSARTMAQTIPGSHYFKLALAAKRAGVYVVAGLVEKHESGTYNSAVLIGPSGTLVAQHRKINELEIALDLYRTGDRLGVVETPFGTIGLAICADNFPDSLAIGHTLCRMGAQLILSPCAWAVDADHDNDRSPYGDLWVRSYSQLAKLFDVTVIGVSNVGPITGGPWAGRKCIGNSLAIGPTGELARGPYDQVAMVAVDVEVRPPIARGTGFSAALKARES